ncbi:hypothetical protein [Metabacillus sediminilitoris]|uniref:Lipoprotein n=1 Tax=Metabacillus sediminilitoris TaxID=2567941 RepID=A0A4S4BTG2_9BACI|nr:hypothetical protein [Metabacillus sediminilitoris]QGQ44232.1 hypothetical protein GMB29_02305 [Metabacillus sediminilitoris]THF78196.1 hypothetical protein E6W99_16720 [Metabacillus sediminilitoris]
MKKLILPFILLTMFMSTACGNQAANEKELEGDKPQEADEEIANEGASESKTDDNKNNQTNDESKEIVQKNAEEVLKLLKAKDGEELSAYVHPEKGVLFSPYVYIESDAVTFDKEKIKGFFEDTKTYTWGAQDGSGEPIELTPSEYEKKYIYNGDFEQADEITVDRVESRGNTIRNISKVFPNSHTVEYYIKGTEENDNMDWKALNLVFEQDAQGEWKLVAIVHDQWTI